MPPQVTVGTPVKNKLLVGSLALMTLGSQRGFSANSQNVVLDELRACHAAVPAPADRPFDSPCGDKIDVLPLKGIPFDRLVTALGKPVTCYVADGDWRLPGKNARCERGAAPGWSFFRLPVGWMGGGWYFLCRLDSRDRCSHLFWRGTK